MRVARLTRAKNTAWEGRWEYGACHKGAVMLGTEGGGPWFGSIKRCYEMNYCKSITFGYHFLG